MKNIICLIKLIPALIIFVFQRADVANRADYVEESTVFKKSIYWSEILPFIIFRWLMVVMQIICITVLLVGTFDVALNNIGEPREGSLGTIIRDE